MENLMFLDKYIKESMEKDIEIIINENQTIAGKVTNVFSNINLEKGKFIVIEMILKRESENCGCDEDPFGIYENAEKKEKKSCDKRLNVELEELEIIDEIKAEGAGIEFTCGINRFSIRRV